MLCSVEGVCRAGELDSVESQMVDDAVIDELRAAAAALSHGDAGPFASMFADDAEWRGVSFGRFWWKRSPS
jgi:hypothetical protein